VHVAIITSVCLACSEVFRSANIVGKNCPRPYGTYCVPHGQLGNKKARATLALAFSDKVIYAVTTALRRVVRPTLIRCPNLTTSKTFLPTLNEQRNSISLRLLD